MVQEASERRALCSALLEDFANCGGNVEATDSRAHPDQASDHRAQDSQARRNSGDQNDGNSKVKSNQTHSKQYDRPHGQTQIEKVLTKF